MIAPFAINSTAVFVFRQYFLQLPPDLFDAARIDGASCAS
jgi:multiple sugar transport system permease protein